MPQEMCSTLLLFAYLMPHANTCQTFLLLFPFAIYNNSSGSRARPIQPLFLGLNCRYLILTSSMGSGARGLESNQCLRPAATACRQEVITVDYESKHNPWRQAVRHRPLRFVSRAEDRWTEARQEELLHEEFMNVSRNLSFV